MAFFNILPIYSLDGYRILKTFLEHFFDDSYTLDLMFYLSILLFVIMVIFFIVFKLYFLIVALTYVFIKMFIERKKNKELLYLEKITLLAK